MGGSHLTLLKGDRRTDEFKDWSKWLKHLAKLVTRFDHEIDDDPLSYNETASVSLLASAASRAGYLGVAEFHVVKGRKVDRRRPSNGRCDFWMWAQRKSYGFEFKQTAPERITRAKWTRAMDEARECARCLRSSEANERIAGLIVSLWHHDDADLEAARTILREVADDCDYSWVVSGAGGETRDTFLYFDVVPFD